MSKEWKREVTDSDLHGFTKEALVALVLSLEETEKDLETKLSQVVRLVADLIEDIDTPSRLGLGEKPNPDWKTLNELREWLANYKETK